MKLVLLFGPAAQTAKRNIALFNQLLLRDNCNHRMVSRHGELTFANYRKIDNATGLLPLPPRRPRPV